MKRTMTIAAALILLLCILIVAGGCGSDMNKAKYQKQQLQSFSIETGGGMNGGRSILKAYSDSGNDIVTVYKLINKAWYLNPRAELYVVDRSLLDEIKQIIIEEKLYNASKAPISEVQVLDGDTTSYHAGFSEGQYFSFSSSQELSSKVYDAIGKIRTIIEEYCENSTAFPTVYAAEEGDYASWEEKEGITVDCTNNAPLQINLNIYNDGSDEVALTGNVTFSKLESDEVIYTEILIENYAVEVYAGGREYITVTFPPDLYPEEGTYKIEYAGYETTFEMKVYTA